MSGVIGERKQLYCSNVERRFADADYMKKVQPFVGKGSSNIEITLVTTYVIARVILFIDIASMDV